LEASSARDLDSQGHRELLAELLRTVAHPGQALTALGQEYVVLVWLGYVTSAARKAAEDHDVGAGAVEVQGDLRRSRTWLIRFALTML
jgi:hypothetical protein